MTIENRKKLLSDLKKDKCFNTIKYIETGEFDPNDLDSFRKVEDFDHTLRHRFQMYFEEGKIGMCKAILDVLEKEHMEAITITQINYMQYVIVRGNWELYHYMVNDKEYDLNSSIKSWSMANIIATHNGGVANYEAHRRSAVFYLPLALGFMNNVYSTEETKHMEIALDLIDRGIKFGISELYSQGEVRHRFLTHLSPYCIYGYKSTRSNKEILPKLLSRCKSVGDYKGLYFLSYSFHDKEFCKKLIEDGLVDSHDAVEVTTLATTSVYWYTSYCLDNGMIGDDMLHYSPIEDFKCDNISRLLDCMEKDENIDNAYMDQNVYLRLYTYLCTAQFQEMMKSEDGKKKYNAFELSLRLKKFEPESLKKLSA